MPNGRPTRRQTPRLARGFAVLIVTLAAACAGCQRFPLRYAEVLAEPGSPPTTRVEPGSGEPAPPAEVGPIPASPLNDAKSPAPAEKAPEPIRPEPPLPDQAKASKASASSPTPLIDAALARAVAVKDLPVEQLEPVPVEEPPANAKAADTPVELPSSREAVTIAPASETKTDDPAKGKDEASATPEPVKAAETSEPSVAKDTAVKALDRKDETAEVMPEPAPKEEARQEPTRPEPKPINPDKPAERLTPRDDWQDGLDRLRAVSTQRAGEPGDGAEAWAIRSRVLDWLADKQAETDRDSGRVWNSVLATLSTATGPETPDDSTLAYHVNAAVDSLESYAPLRITALSFCRKIDGFGHYDPVENPAVRRGHPLLVYCEMAGLRYESEKDAFRSRLASQVEVVPSGGGAAVWSEALGTAEDLCRRRRRDYFVNYRIVIPAHLAAGSYALRLSQTDLISNRSVSASVPFTVEP